MKKIIASAGLLALGITASKAAGVTVNEPHDKVWGVSTSLRGFYDDNYALAPNNKQDSWGMEFNPGAKLDLEGQQTALKASYSYTMRDFFDRVGKNVDHTHEFNLSLDHRFSERYSVDLRDSLVITEEPALASSTGPVRTEGNVVHNEGRINFRAQVTRLFGIVTGYRNALYNYENKDYSALLDRLEHYGNIDFTWQVAAQSTAFFGYQFGVVDYTSDKTISSAYGPGGFNGKRSETRNSRSHYAYAGIRHHFTPQLSGSLKAGAQFVEYYNLPAGLGMSRHTVSPYVEASLRYNYQPTSHIEVGFQQVRTQTDVNATDGQSSVLYATISHSFTPKLIGSLTGLGQFSDYDTIGGKSVESWLYSVGLNLEYRFTRNLSANVAYNYDAVESDIANYGYDRNRVFMGANFNY